MRLDKYLKVSRLIKRRTVANEVADAGRILINGKIAKAHQGAGALGCGTPHQGCGPRNVRDHQRVNGIKALVWCIGCTRKGETSNAGKKHQKPAACAAA